MLAFHECRVGLDSLTFQSRSVTWSLCWVNEDVHDLQKAPISCGSLSSHHLTFFWNWQRDLNFAAFLFFLDFPPVATTVVYLLLRIGTMIPLFESVLSWWNYCAPSLRRFVICDDEAT